MTQYDFAIGCAEFRYASVSRRGIEGDTRFSTFSEGGKLELFNLLNMRISVVS
jgi:hypothetical protein